MELSDLEKGYIAGFLDGEGCISIYHSKWQPSGWMQITFSNTNRETLEWIQKRTKGRIQIIHKAKGNYKAAYNLMLFARQAQELLKQLLPHLQSKHLQAEIAIQWQNTKTYAHKKERTITLVNGRFTLIPKHILQQRQQLEHQIHTLNHRGTTPYKPSIIVI